jgi:putative transposase
MIRAKVVKTIKARLQMDEERARQLEGLYAIWNEMLKYCVHNYFSQLWRGVSESTLYYSMRKRFPHLYSYHILSVIRIAKGKVQRVRTSIIENKDYRAKLQKRWGNDPVQLYYNQTYWIGEKRNRLYAKIAYMPKNPIEVKLLLTERDESLIRNALDGEYRLGGALLLKRNNEWQLHIVIEKEVSLPRWQDCNTIIGVDVGIRNLAYATAYDIANRRFYGETLSIKGNYYRHIVRAYRGKLASIQSIYGSLSKRYRKMQVKYNRIRDEIYHTVAKRIVEYAKKFPKPLIVLENLSELESNGQTKTQRYELSLWARKRIQQYITYKALWEGIPCIMINPHYTSVNCNKCGKRGERNKWQFKCPYCEYTAYIDDNASRNIASRALQIINSCLVDAQLP